MTTGKASMIGVGEMSTGTVTIEDAGSQWLAGTHSLEIDALGGTGTLVLQNGAAAEFGFAVVGLYPSFSGTGVASNGTLKVLSGSTLTSHKRVVLHGGPVPSRTLATTRPSKRILS